MQPDEGEREGYVPNVVYTRGSMLSGNELIIPYGLADYEQDLQSFPSTSYWRRWRQSDDASTERQRKWTNNAREQQVTFSEGDEGALARAPASARRAFPAPEGGRYFKTRSAKLFAYSEASGKNPG